MCQHHLPAPGGNATSESKRPRKYPCTYKGCNKRYSRPCLVKQHERAHYDDRSFLCSFPGCGKGFLRNSHLKVHMLTHKAEKPHVCPHCGKGFNTGQQISRHLKAHRNKATRTYRDKSGAKVTATKTEAVEFEQLMNSPTDPLFGMAQLVYSQWNHPTAMKEEGSGIDGINAIDSALKGDLLNVNNVPSSISGSSGSDIPSVSDFTSESMYTPETVSTVYSDGLHDQFASAPISEFQSSIATPLLFESRDSASSVHVLSVSDASGPTDPFKLEKDLAFPSVSQPTFQSPQQNFQVPDTHTSQQAFLSGLPSQQTVPANLTPHPAFSLDLSASVQPLSHPLTDPLSLPLSDPSSQPGVLAPISGSSVFEDGQCWWCKDDACCGVIGYGSLGELIQHYDLSHHYVPEDLHILFEDIVARPPADDLDPNTDLNYFFNFEEGCPFMVHLGIPI